MKITSPDDLFPKRFPRKTKKKYIKAWGRDVYKGILKGTYIIAPYTTKITKTILIDNCGEREINHLRAIYQYEK